MNYGKYYGKWLIITEYGVLDEKLVFRKTYKDTGKEFCDWGFMGHETYKPVPVSSIDSIKRLTLKEVWDQFPDQVHPEDFI